MDQKDFSPIMTSKNHVKSDFDFARQVPTIKSYFISKVQFKHKEVKRKEI